MYTEVANCSLGSCPMKDRDTWLDEIPLTSDQVLVSDIYVVRNGPLRTSSEIDIDFTFTPMSSTKNKNIKVIAKQDGEWTEVEAVTEVIKTLFHTYFFVCLLFSSHSRIFPSYGNVSNADESWTMQLKFLVRVTCYANGMDGKRKVANTFDGSVYLL